MPTTVTRYVDPDATGANDGTSWTDAWTALNSINNYGTKDLVTNDITLQVYVRSSGGTADTTPFIADGAWRTDATRKVTIESTQPPGGKWRNTYYRLETTTARAINMVGGTVSGIHHCVLKNLQVSYAGATTAQGVWASGGTNPTMTIDGCFIRTTVDAGTSAIPCLLANFDLPNAAKLINTVIDANGKDDGLRIVSCTASGIALYNCTIANADIPINNSVAAGAVTAKNNVFTGCANNASVTVFSATSDYNASDRSELTAQANSRQLQTFTFLDAANADFRLARTDAGARTYGVDLSEDGVYPFAVDAEGGRRGTTWDIGADQVTGFTDTVVAGKYVMKGYPVVETGSAGTVTVVVRYVDPGAVGANNGTSWTDAWNGVYKIDTYAKNLVTANERLHVYCRSTGGVADDNAWSATTTWVTDADHNITIEGTEDHGGYWNTGVYRLYNSNIDNNDLIGITAGINNLALKNLQARHSGTSTYRCVVKFQRTNGTLEVDRCVLIHDGDVAGHAVIQVRGMVTPAALKVRNSLLVGGQYGVLSDTTDTASGVVLYNNTFINNRVPCAGKWTGAVLAKNNIFDGTASASLVNSSDMAAGCTHNAVRGTGVGLPGSNRTSQTFTYEDSANYNYHLGRGDTGARGYGTNLASDALYTVTEDIDGQPRAGVNYDIGYDQTIVPMAPLPGIIWAKGYEVGEVANPPNLGYRPDPGVFLFKGYAVTAEADTKTKTAEAGRMILKGLEAVSFKSVLGDYGGVAGKFTFKGYAPVDLNTRTFSPYAGDVTLKEYPVIGGYGKTKIVEAGCLWMYRGYEARNYYPAFVSAVAPGKLWFKTFEAVAGRGATISEPALSVLHLKGHAAEANAAVRTKAVVAGKWFFVGALPEANAPEINAPVVAGTLTFKGYEARGFSGRITDPVVGVLSLLGLEAVVIKQYVTNVPATQKYTFKGHAPFLVREVLKYARKGSLRLVGKEVTGMSGGWTTLSSDPVVADDWADIPADRIR